VTPKLGARIAIVGTSRTGKTTLARSLGRALGARRAGTP